MKRVKTTKLSIGAETLRVLVAAELGGVNGARWTAPDFCGIHGLRRQQTPPTTSEAGGGGSCPTEYTYLCKP